jgi:hypothetical protein
MDSSPADYNREGFVQLTKALIKGPLINAFVFSMVIQETGTIVIEALDLNDFIVIFLLMKSARLLKEHKIHKF